MNKYVNWSSDSHEGMIYVCCGSGRNGRRWCLFCSGSVLFLGWGAGWVFFYLWIVGRAWVWLCARMNGFSCCSGLPLYFLSYLVHGYSMRLICLLSYVNKLIYSSRSDYFALPTPITLLIDTQYTHHSSWHYYTINHCFYFMWWLFFTMFIYTQNTTPF